MLASLLIKSMIKSYLTIFISIGSGAIFIFITGIYWIFKKNKPETKKSFDMQNALSVSLAAEEKNISKPDFSAISGDDIFATQLDLARAYIELGRKQSARKILEEIMEQGSAEQQGEAQELLGFI